MTETTEPAIEETTPSPQSKAAKKSAAKKPASKPKAEVAAPAPPPNILFGPSNADLNPAYAE